MDPTSDPRQNWLLSALADAEWQRIAPHLEPIELHLGQMLFDSGGKPSHVYFPTTAIVSLLYVMENGASAEIAGVGREGIVGVPMFTGGETSPSRSVVQTGGAAWRLRQAVLMDEFNRGEAMMRVLLHYTQALITQMSLTAACNRRHSLEQQLCRWLLLTLDRSEGNELIMTQELIASMLGVRREGVTEAAGRLQRAGMISYRRGHITVLSRDGLQERVCECYGQVRGEFERLAQPRSATSPA